MLAELVGWYTGREENRRRYPRIKKDYNAEYSLGADRWAVLHGIDLSGGGMCVVSEHIIPNVTFDVRVMLGDREISLRVRPVWNATTNYKGRILPTYGMQFVSVGAEDWETIITWITGDDPTKSEGFAAIQMSDVEVGHLIPAVIRDDLLDALTRRSRFDPRKPLPVQYDYAGIGRHNGRAVHKLTLHSKVHNGAREIRYSTQFRVSEMGEVIVIS
jgi:hypothetical protein